MRPTVPLPILMTPTLADKQRAILALYSVGKHISGSPILDDAVNMSVHRAPEAVGIRLNVSNQKIAYLETAEGISVRLSKTFKPTHTLVNSLPQFMAYIKRHNL